MHPSPPIMVKIGHIRYSVSEVADLKYEEVRVNGTIDYTFPEILLEDRLPGQTKAVCLWHEIVHAIAYQNNIDLSESEVRTLGYVLAALVQDNAELVNYTQAIDRLTWSPPDHYNALGSLIPRLNDEE